ncbi:MAG: RusA family crossover junction endodeoxyribonuclease [Crinalium sp.]
MEFFKLWLPGNVVPKARPRLSIHGAYLPKRYSDWRKIAESEIALQINDYSLFPLTTPVSIRIILQGKHRTNIDLDNAAGALLDCIVATGILVDDSIKNVSKLIVEYQSPGELGAWIEIEDVN